MVIQPGLGKAADAWSFGTAYIISAGIQLLTLPFILLARRERVASDEEHELTRAPTTAPTPASDRTRLGALRVENAVAAAESVVS